MVEMIVAPDVLLASGRDTPATLSLQQFFDDAKGHPSHLVQLSRPMAVGGLPGALVERPYRGGLIKRFQPAPVR